MPKIAYLGTNRITDGLYLSTIARALPGTDVHWRNLQDRQLSPEQLQDYDIVLIDNTRTSRDNGQTKGMKFLVELKQSHPDLPVIMTRGDNYDNNTAIELGAETSVDEYALRNAMETSKRLSKLVLQLN